MPRPSRAERCRPYGIRGSAPKPGSGCGRRRGAAGLALDVREVFGDEVRNLLRLLTLHEPLRHPALDAAGDRLEDPRVVALDGGGRLLASPQELVEVWPDPPVRAGRLQRVAGPA